MGKNRQIHTLEALVQCHRFPAPLNDDDNVSHDQGFALAYGGGSAVSPQGVSMFMPTSDRLSRDAFRFAHDHLRAELPCQVLDPASIRGLDGLVLILDDDYRRSNDETLRHVAQATSLDGVMVRKCDSVIYAHHVICTPSLAGRCSIDMLGAVAECRVGGWAACAAGSGGGGGGAGGGAGGGLSLIHI